MSGNTFRGGGGGGGGCGAVRFLNTSRPVPYAKPLLPSFLFLWLPFSLSCGFFLEWLFAYCNFLRCREQFY